MFIMALAHYNKKDQVWKVDIAEVITHTVHWLIGHSQTTQPGNITNLKNPTRYKGVGKTKKHSGWKGFVHMAELDRMTSQSLKKVQSPKVP